MFFVSRHLFKLRNVKDENRFVKTFVFLKMRKFLWQYRYQYRFFYAIHYICNLFKYNLFNGLQTLQSYHEELPLIKSHDLLRVFRNTSQTKNIVSPLPECLWPPNPTGLQLTVIGSCSYSHMTLWSRVPGRSRNKPKSLYLSFQSPYGH